MFLLPSIKSTRVLRLLTFFPAKPAARLVSYLFEQLVESCNLKSTREDKTLRCLAKTLHFEAKRWSQCQNYCALHALVLPETDPFPIRVAPLRRSDMHDNPYPVPPVILGMDAGSTSKDHFFTSLHFFLFLSLLNHTI